MGIDVAAVAGQSVFVSGYNPHPTNAVSIWLLRSNARQDSPFIDERRCVVNGMATSETPSGQPGSSADVVRWGHLDLEASNPKNLQVGVWKRLVTAPGFTSIVYSLSQVGAYAGPADPCGWGTSGPHLHMDAPIDATRNCSLQARDGDNIGPSYGTSTNVFEFGGSSMITRPHVRFSGRERTYVGSRHDASYEFFPGDPPKRIHEVDIPIFRELSDFEVLDYSDPTPAPTSGLIDYTDLEGGCRGC